MISLRAISAPTSASFSFTFGFASNTRSPAKNGTSAVKRPSSFSGARIGRPYLSPVS